MASEPLTDPAESDLRPRVAAPSSNRAVWVFAAVMAVGATSLFAALEAKRSVITSPATAVPAASTSGMLAPPPELVIPPVYEPYAEQPLMAPPLALAPVVPGRAVSPRTPTPRTFAPTYSSPPTVYPAAGPATGAPVTGQPPSFAYRAPPQDPPSPLKDDGSPNSGSGKERVLASRFINPSTTVPQGTVIQAVLETALDSNRGGFARAIVSRDVMSFDGSRVLIPRGSKLFGDYKADLAAGQNRAMIQWHRLTRPDGGIIDVDSPSADPLGRAGVKGKVNSHFLARFGGAILQSALDIGTAYANRGVGGDIYYFGGLNSMQGVVQSKSQDIKPTLTVRQGSSVSVFVARDLDFTSVEQ